MQFLEQGVTALQQFMGFESYCSQAEMDKGNEIKKIHDLIEEVAYKAFAQAVVDLNIRDDKITEEQSGTILSRIKCSAHKEMFKRGGYISERATLPLEQVQELIANVGKIIHDRDTKLTDARYYTLTDMLMGLDDHNTMVKEILLRSWFKCPKLHDPGHSHLEQIKERVGFYATMDRQLSFNLKKSLLERQAFWNKYFPGMREASETASAQFVRILEVRNYFSGTEGCNADIALIIPRRLYSLCNENLEKKISDFLSAEDLNTLFEARRVKNIVRKCEQDTGYPLIGNRDITLREFFNRFFPEIEVA